MAKRKAPALTTIGTVFSVTKDIGAIGLMIDNLRSRNQSFMADAHTAACACIVHVTHFTDADGKYFGNPDVANQLCDVLSEDKRANSLRLWFETIGPFKWNKEKKKLVLDKARIADFRAQDEDTLSAKLAAGITFWKLDPPKEYKGFNLSEIIRKAIVRAENIVDGGDPDPRDVIDSDLLAKLKALLPQDATAKAA